LLESWNAGGFGEALKTKPNMLLKTVEIYYSGQEVGKGIRSISLAEVDNEIGNFASIAPNGTPISCLLEKYTVHPDYAHSVVDRPTKLSPYNEFVNDIIY